MKRKAPVQSKARDANRFSKTRKVYDTTGSSQVGDRWLDWHMYEGEELAEKVFGRVRQIKAAQITRRFELFTYQQAYNSRFGANVMSTLFASGQRGTGTGFYALSANIIKSCVDTACARIAKAKPRPFVLPNRGDHRIEKKCKDLTKFLDGAMQSARVYENAEEVFRDACIYDGGHLILQTEDGEVMSFVGKVDEVVTDMADGMYGQPTERHWTHAVPRRELLARYPEHAQQINDARSAWRGEQSFLGQADLIEVIKSWRLPSKKGGSDGVYAVSITNCCLDKQDYAKDYIPIFTFHWTTPTYGPFGDGIAKELFGMQRNLSDILRGIVKSIRMFAVPRVWVNKQANAGVVQITNEISVNEYSGEKPVFDTPPAASADIYQFVQWIIDWAYKQLGLSQLSAQSEKPAGLNSGVAMRTYQDVETQRFAIVGQRWERWYMSVAKAMIDMAGDLYKDNRNLSVKVPGRGFIETVNWSDVSLEADQYDVQVWPTNILPEQPEGRLQTAQEYVASGFMPQAVAVKELRIPVLNDWVDQMVAPTEAINWALSKIVDDGIYIEPDPLITQAQPELVIQLAGAAYARETTREGKFQQPHVVDMLIRYYQQAISIKTASTPTPQPQPGPGGAVGQAAAPPPAPLAPTGSGPVSAPQQAAA